MRRPVSGVYLLEVLNQRLARYGHCQDCRFAGPIKRLKEATPDGLNWSRYLALTCQGELPAGCRRTAERVLADVAREYNLIQSEVEDLWAAPTRPASS